MASIFGFRTRSADRDGATDAGRLARMKALIAQVAAEIEAESTGLEKRCRNEATDAGFLVEAIDNDEVSARSEARVEELTSSLLRGERRLATLSRQLVLLDELLALLQRFADDDSAADRRPHRQGQT